jgi:2-dehydropantoate 2-reductase
MRIGVVGAGAIGGWIGAKLAARGHEVSVYARGATLDAVRAHGLRLREGGRLIQAQVKACDDAAALGAQELVIVAVKGPALAAVAPAVAAMTGQDTVVVPAMNGVPWWFFTGFGGPLEGAGLTSLDPDGVVQANIPAGRVLGCVVHAACRLEAPGLVVHSMGDKLILGEPAGGGSARLERTSAALGDAGFEVVLSPQIQRDIWYKLWGNMTMNPVSALTGATCDRILDDAEVRGFVHAVMAEAREIGERIGCPIAESAEDRGQVTRKLGAFKTSMLQDVDANRPLEIDALLSAPREIAGRLGLETPSLDALLGLVRLFAGTRGLY